MNRIKFFVIPLFLLSTYSIAQELTDTQRHKLLENCKQYKLCSYQMAGYAVGPSTLNVYIKKELYNLINKPDFIRDYYIDFLNSKSVNQRIEFSDKLKSNAPFFQSFIIREYIRNTQSLLIMDYDTEDVIAQYGLEKSI